MSSFFTTPASQNKRKREYGQAVRSKKRQQTTQSKSTKANGTRPRRDESISSEASEEETVNREGGSDGASDSTGADDEEETAAERRLRLAEQYLENIKGEVEEIGFDAKDIDRDLIAERLQQDVAETKGKLYKHIATTLDFQSASKAQFRAETLTTTAIATCPPYAYTVSRDLTLIKWELLDPPKSSNYSQTKNPNSKPNRRRPKKLVSTRGDKRKANESSYMHHTAPILCIAASDTGTFIATGGADKRLIVWSAADLKPLRVFTQHRDAVTGLAFRKGTNQLFSSSKDRTIKTWSLNELAYVETLFGHQDEVVDITAGAVERCISVGARDRTARVWKVIEETQLVFRGGGGGSTRTPKPIEPTTTTSSSTSIETAPKPRIHPEGSIDRIALIDEETFVTGSDNGSLCLWTLQKKKPVFTVPLAHGLDSALRPTEASAERDADERSASTVVPQQSPRWITALATVPYSDLVLSGSWDGGIRVWRVGEGKRRLESLGVVQMEGEGEDREGGGGGGVFSGLRGIVNDLSAFERGKKGQETLCIVAAIGTEHRLGRWKKVKGWKSGAVVFEVPRRGDEVRRSGNDTTEGAAINGNVNHRASKS